ncbi:hypothetical protein ACWDYJ_23365 [Streptomyces sp. NPDC003042]
MEEVFLAQEAQRVCVGDPAQQIYGWRNARDVMTGFPAEQLRLTKSFRFGPAIAGVVNRWLTHAGSEMRLTGHGSHSRVGDAPHPRAVLCRGNADAMSEVLSYLELGIPVALTGGGSALQRTATAALELKAGRRTSHPELFLFSSWDEVQEYAEQDKAGPAEPRRSPSDLRRGHPRPPPARHRRHRLDRRLRNHHGDSGPNGTAAGSPPAELSLSGQLKYDSSPISCFMAAHLPYSQNLVGDYQAYVARLPHPVQPIDVRYPHWAALGPAVDAGVMLLDAAVPPRGAPEGESRKALHSAGEQLLATIGTCGGLDDETLTRLCFVAGFFEDIARTGEIRRFSLLSAATPGTCLDDLTAAVPPYVLDDIGQQMRLAHAPFAPFRALPQASRICGPVFTGSADLGGADADFIVGGCLLDCKATKDPRRLGREEIYQLAGYLLLDYDNQFGIDRVRLYLSRQGGLITWDTADFLRRLGATSPLPTLRAHLRHHLRSEPAGPIHLDA